MSGRSASSTGATVIVDALGAVDAHDGGREVERDVEVVQALHDVARQAVGVRHQLEHAHHLHPLQDQPPRHDQADVARAEDRDAPCRGGTRRR
jgi:hypothetical protein